MNDNRIDNKETKLPITGKLKSYWDPLYNPMDIEPFPPITWDFKNSTGVKHSTCNAETLEVYLGSQKTKINHSGSISHSIKNTKFEKCNFRGDFNFVKLTFNKCEFELCDFGYASWEKVKFSGCTFKKCSFTMLTFTNCQFIDCKWEDIGLSGNETQISNCIMTNPQQFIKSAFTCNDENVLKQFNTNPSYQKMRLEKTKAKLARIVLTNLERIGDDESYYEAIAIYLNQTINARKAEYRHKIFSKKNKSWNNLLICMCALEQIILNISGKINGWGKSIARPTLIGILLILCFGALYYFLGIKTSLGTAIMAGFDVTLLFGYTKHANLSSDTLTQGLFGLNAFLGLWWYAVFVPTIINRISRVR